MENRIPIWGETIPGNRPESKRDVMDWHEEYTQEDLFMKYPGIWDKSTPEIGDLSGNDTMVYRQEIQTGLAKETYEDVPFLIPYLKEGSDRCVIICPDICRFVPVVVDCRNGLSSRLNCKCRILKCC